MENPTMDYFESEPLEELPFMEPLNNSLLPINFNNIKNIYNIEYQMNGEQVDMFLKEIGEIFDNSNDKATSNQRTYATLMPLTTNVNQNAVQHNEMNNLVPNLSKIMAFSQSAEANQFIDNPNSINNQRTYTTLMPISSNIDQNHHVQHNEMINLIPNLSNPEAFCQSTQIWSSNNNPADANQFNNNQNSANNQRTYTTLMSISSNIVHNHHVQHNEMINLIPNLSNPETFCQSTQAEAFSTNQTHANIVTDSVNSVMSNQVPLQIFDLNQVSWVFASHRISKNQKTPKICYQPNQSIIPNDAILYIYYDLYEMPYTIMSSDQYLPMPRISAHRMRTSNKKVFPVKPLVEPMTLESDGLYHFQMPSFILNKTKEYGPTLRKEWRLKYKELLEITGNIDELSQSYTHYDPNDINNNNNNNSNTNLNVQIDNLISKHLLNGTNIYKYVCLGIYICEKYMDENSMFRYRKIDGPFYSEKLATLEKENL